MEHTDENHVLCADEIVSLLGDMGIHAERRSIYIDIEEINKALYMMEQGCTIEEAAEDLKNPDYEDEKAIAYQELGRKEKGYYVRRRKYDLLDLRLLAECAYSTRFLTQGQSDHLINDVICEYASKHQRDQIRHDAFLTDRVKTVNKAMLRNLEAINNAMRYGTRVNPHDPEKIKIVYVKRVMKQEGIRTTEKTIITLSKVPILLCICILFLLCVCYTFVIPINKKNNRFSQVRRFDTVHLSFTNFVGKSALIQRCNLKPFPASSPL